MQERKLLVYGHMMHMNKESCIKKCQFLIVEETCGMGRSTLEDMRQVVKKGSSDIKFPQKDNKGPKLQAICRDWENISRNIESGTHAGTM